MSRFRKLFDPPEPIVVEGGWVKPSVKGLSLPCPACGEETHLYSGSEVNSHIDLRMGRGAHRELLLTFNCATCRNGVVVDMGHIPEGLGSKFPGLRAIDNGHA